MATKHTDRCLLKAADDEPIFVLRAQDKLAPQLVQIWAVLAQSEGVTSGKVIEAYELANTMKAWQNNNKVKLPD